MASIVGVCLFNEMAVDDSGFALSFLRTRPLVNQ